MHKETHLKKWCYTALLGIRTSRREALLLFCLLVGTYSLAARTLDLEKRVTVDMQKRPLSEVFESIKSQTSYSFWYNVEEVDISQKTTLQVKDEKLGTTLALLSENTQLAFDPKNDHIVVTPRHTEAGTNASAKQPAEKRQVTGVIKNSEGESLPGVTVLLKGSPTVGTSSDEYGFYSLEVPTDAVLIFSYISYQTKEESVRGRKELNVILQDDNLELGEVVVVAFGTQRKANLTAAVASIESKRLADRPVQNLSQALQGVSPGLNITAANMGGDLNSTAKINIRGVGSIGKGSSSDPLVLIDGMPGDINLLNVQDVENISILKDAGAAAIYGSRAAFGVILITTKKGKEGRTVVNYNNNFRSSTPTKLPSFVNGYDFNTYFNEAAANSGVAAPYSPDVMEKTKLFMEGKLAEATEYDSNGIWKKNLDSWGNTEWFSEYYKKWAFSQEHNLSISGGTEKLKYYVSGNFQNIGTDQRYGNENYKRYTFNSNINAALYSWLDMNVNTKFSRKNYIAPNYQRHPVYYHSMPRRKPANPVYTPDGILHKESQLNEMTRGGDYTDDNDILYQQIQFVLKPMQALKVFAEMNYRVDRTEIHSEVLPILERKEDGTFFNMDRDDGMTGRTLVREETQRSNYYNPNLYANYSGELGDHSFQITAGVQAELTRYKSVLASRDDLISPTVPTLGNAISTKNFVMDSDIYEWATAGLFGRLNYDYKGRYLAEFNVRRDGSSRFLRDQRWNTFPSVSAAWNVAQEPFMESVQRTVNVLKLRGSWGALGNQSTKMIYPFYPAMGIGTGAGRWLINWARPNISNPAAPISPYLTWERVYSYNIGVDFALFNNRLTGTFDHFWRTTEDMVAPGEELPTTAGVVSPFTNNATMRTVGYELSIGWRDVLSNGLSYGATAVLSDNQSTILRYPNDTKNLGTSTNDTRILKDIYYEGMKLGEIWGYETIGLAKTPQEMQDHLASLPHGGQSALGSDWSAGDVMYKDLNGDGKIDGGKGVVGESGDRRVIGNSTPRYNFGVNLYAAYKGFDLSLFVQGTMKRDVWLTGLYFWGADNGYWQSAALKETMDYFRPADTGSHFGPNPDGYLPRPLLRGDRKNKSVNDRYLQNGAYVRLKNVQLGYTLPQPLVSKLSVQNLRLFISAENVLTLSGLKADAFDPEVLDGYQDGSGKAPPLKTTLSCGISITL